MNRRQFNRTTIGAFLGAAFGWLPGVKSAEKGIDFLAVEPGIGDTFIIIPGSGPIPDKIEFDPARCHSSKSGSKPGLRTHDIWACRFEPPNSTP